MTQNYADLVVSPHKTFLSGAGNAYRSWPTVTASIRW